MRINVKLVSNSQFLKEIYLYMQYKLKKKYIILNALSRLVSVNSNLPTANLKYSELDVFYTYSAMLVELTLILLTQIVYSYKKKY